ncbi:MAG: NAD-dependent epimerase/dehydratase family protein [Candidatus Margulisiibacteriota bacterium]
MKVLITGGAGFIGSHLAEAFLNRGDEVVVVDNLSTGRKFNIKHLMNNDRFTAHFNTILNRALMKDLIFQCDEIYHLAAPVGVKWIMDHPIQTILENVRGIDIILELADKHKKKVLIASTSEVYGKHLEHTLCEDDNRVMGSVRNHRWAYANTKTMDEFLALAYYKENKTPVVIVRLFNTVGPRQTGQYGMVVPTFVKKALNGEPLPVFGDGTQSRSFTYVKDVVKGIIDLMAEPRAYGDIFNIGNGEEITIEALAKLVIKKTGSKSDITYIPYIKAYGEGFEDMQRRTPNITKIRELTGYKPTLSIEGILDQIITYYKNGGE